MKTDKLDIPIFDLTIRELVQMFNNLPNVDDNKNLPAENKELERVRGMKSMARVLDCSVNTIAKYKKQGVFKKSLIQRGRTIIFYKELAIEEFNERKNR